MPSLSGITEVIGVRAVIIDVRQYLADGREIERINDRMGASTLRLQQSTAKSAVATANANAVFKRAVADRKLLTQAINDEFAAEQKLNNLRNAPVNRNAAGQFIKPTPAGQLGTNAPAAVQADIAQAQKELAFQQSLRAFISKGFTQSSKEAIAAGSAEAVQLANNTRLLEQQAAVEAQLADAKRSRIKAAASGVALVGVAAIGVTAGASIAVAAKYQQELSKINVLTSATDEQTQQLGQSFLKLSTEIPVSASDLAAAAYKLLSSGIKDTGQALEITTNAAKAATAGQADIKDIISATIAVLNGYPKGAINAAQVNDILFAGVKEGAAEFNDFAGSIGKLIPIAAALGVPFDQLTASMAVLTNGGLSAEEAATGLRAILNDLAKDESSKQAADALATVGLTVEQLRRNIVEKGLPQAMGELINLFKGNLAAIEPIIPNIRGMVAAYSAFSDSGKTTTGVLQNIDNSAGIVNNSFEKVKNNTANVAKIFSNTLNVALIEIGNAILPSVTKALQDLVTWVQANREGIQKFVAEGLQGIIDIGRDAAKGIKTLAEILGTLYGVLQSIVGTADATRAALALIGTGLAWALPGGKTFAGLTAILLLLGEIQDLASGNTKDKSAKGIVDKFGLPLAGGIAGGLLGFGAGGPFGAVLGASAGVQGGGILRDALGLNPDKKGTSGADAAKEALDRVNKSAEQLGKITLPPLAVNVGGVDQAAKKASETLKQLAQDFLKSSEAAGQVKSLTEEFGKFGNISKQLADAAGLSAAQAGQIQGVDAVIRARERENAEIFNNIEAINAISRAYRESAAVGRQLLLDLAQASLEASQKALSDVFSRPTREVADLNVNLARQQLTTAQITQRNSPQINALKQQLENINRQITRQNQANALANREAERNRRAQQAAQKAQQDAAQSQLDALQLANTIASINAERQLAALQKLIDSNNKAASDLQETFLKNNDALQKQINEAIGKGDSKTALTLVEQQRAATKQYRDQSKALQQSTQNLTAQQKAAQEAEAERQRQVKLQEALLQSQQKQQKSTDDLSDSLDTAKDAQDAQTQALEDSKQAIEDQIDALQKPIDASQEQEKAIQDNIAVFEAQTNVLKALGVAADHTLLTQDQQRQAAEHFTAQIDVASGYAQTLAKSFYDFIPGAEDANIKFGVLKDAVQAVNSKIDPGLLGSFDAVKARLDLLAKAQDDATTTFNNANTQTSNNTQDVQKLISDTITAQEQFLVAELNNAITADDVIKGKLIAIGDDIASNLKGLPDKFSSVIDKFGKKINDFDFGSFLKSIKNKIPGLAVGGIVTRPTLSLIGEAGPEAVLPLNDPKRINQLLSQAVGVGTVGTAYANLSPASTGYPTVGPTGSGLVGGGLKQPLSAYDLYFGPRDNSRYGSPMVVQMPSSLTAALSTAGKASPIFAPNITVTGETLDTMEATAIRAVQAAFRDARVISGRSGGLISQGIGPSR